MQENPDTMLRESYVYYPILWIAVLALIFLPACSVKHEIPVADKIVDKIANLKPPVTCRRVDLPPVPAEVHLDISGDKITADPGGETVFRGYAACRSLYRDVPSNANQPEG
jgi:hypothetical protein